MPSYKFMFQNCQSRTGDFLSDKIEIESELKQHSLDKGKITSYFSPSLNISTQSSYSFPKLVDSNKGSMKQVEGTFSLIAEHEPHIVCLAESQQHTVAQLSNLISKTYKCISQIGYTKDKPMTLFVHNSIFSSTPWDNIKVPGMGRLMPTFLLDKRVLVSFVHTVHTNSSPDLETIAALKKNLELSATKFKGTCGLVCGDFNVDISEKNVEEALSYVISPDWALLVPTDKDGQKTVSRPASQSLIDFGATRAATGYTMKSTAILHGKKFGSDHKPLLIDLEVTNLFGM